MDYKSRNKKLRLLITRLNRERKTTAKKIDILCNDLIGAQREFIRRLNTINFAADFYESIIGTTDRDSLIFAAGKLIRDEIINANVVFFLRRKIGFDLHIFESDQPILSKEYRLENYFTDELVDNICKSNKHCTLDCLIGMGLQANPSCLNKLSAVTIPLGQFGSSLGFILIYRLSENKLTESEINHISAITCGLSRALAACPMLSPITS